MNIPTSRYSIFASLVLGAILVAPPHLHAQGCGADNNGGGDNFDPGNINSQDQVDMLNSGGNVAGGVTLGPDTGSGSVSFTPTPDPINVTINCSTTIYAQSPTSVSSTAWTSSTPISLHTIEYINADGSSGGFWTIDIAAGTSISDQRSLGVTFPSPGTYLVRSGASTDGGNTWTYSDQVSVTVNDCINIHTVTIQTIPKPGMEQWFTPSNVVSKTFRVRHTNPYP